MAAHPLRLRPCPPWACAPAVCLRRPPGFRAVAFLSLGRCLVFASVCFGGSRELPSSFGAFVGGVVGRVLAAAPRASFSVGCAVWRGCAGVAVAGGAWRCFSCLGLLRWGCVGRGLLALLGFLGGPVRGCGWRVPGLARGRSALGPAGGAAGGSFARGARPWRRPGVGRVLVPVLARVAVRSLRPGRRRLRASRSSSSVAGGSLLCSLRCAPVVRGSRCSAARLSAASSGSRRVLSCPRGPRSAVRRVAGCRGVPSLRRSVRPARVRRCSPAVRSGRSASAGELLCCPSGRAWRSFRRAAPFFAVSAATSASVRPSIASTSVAPTTSPRNAASTARGVKSPSRSPTKNGITRNETRRTAP